MGKVWEQGGLDQDESSSSPVPSERGSGSWSEDSFESEDSSYQSTARGSGVSMTSPSVSSRETEPRMEETGIALHRQTAFDEELSQYSEHEIEDDHGEYHDGDGGTTGSNSQPSQQEQWEEVSYHSDSYTSASRSRYSDYSSRRSSFASFTDRGDASQDVSRSNYDEHQGSYHSSDSGSAASRSSNRSEGSAPSYERDKDDDQEQWDQGSYQSPPTSESPGTSRGGGSATSTRDQSRGEPSLSEQVVEEAGEPSIEPGDLAVRFCRGGLVMIRPAGRRTHPGVNPQLPKGLQKAIHPDFPNIPRDDPWAHRNERVIMDRTARSKAVVLIRQDVLEAQGHPTLEDLVRAVLPHDARNIPRDARRAVHLPREDLVGAVIRPDTQTIPRNFP
eukprot:Nitzschia sp. Nitz4//scaffold26_size159584//94112//95300//NITZ4_002499-RA/size159584-processed-gene-0.198-mRNA-1//1//CDS//3329545106//1271//frame0